MKILIIDDSKTSLLLTKIALEGMGHQVLESLSGDEGIKIFKQEKLDLVILDVEMDGMDGFECSRNLRKLMPKGDWIPIIFLSGLINDESIAAGIDAGGDDYLIKPFSEITLNAKIRAMERITDMRKQLSEANKQLNKLSLTDGLTGVANRRAFGNALKKIWSSTQRQSDKNPIISMIMIDIDCFKLFNDQYGHQAGDECLKKVSEALESVINRKDDLVCRYGGEEFAVILPDTEKNAAVKLAESMRAKVESLNVKHENSVVIPRVTISLGVSSTFVANTDSSEKLIYTADAALYLAKKNGRNQVCYQEIILEEV